MTTDTSEAHGVLCGALCTRAGYGAADWLGELASERRPVTSAPDPELLSLPGQVQDALCSPDLEFEPLLPADDTPLADRVSSLAAWCNGFLYGVGAGALKPDALRDPDLDEYLRDLADISRAELEPGRDGEAGEGDFFELVEFVRAGAQLAFDGLAKARSHAA